jgi:serine/threonine protein kinase
MRRQTKRKHFHLRRRKSRKQRGGKIIGSGTTAFAVYPAIPCEGIDTSNKISKVFKIPRIFSGAKDKLTPVVEVLKRIDPERKHFIYPEFCDKPGDLTDEMLADGVTPDNKTMSYLLDYGGIDIETLFNFFPLIPLALKFFEGEELKSKLDLLYNKFKPLALQLYTSLSLLHSNHLIHSDLHLGNIVCNDDVLIKQLNASKLLQEKLQQPSKSKKTSIRIGLIDLSVSEPIKMSKDESDELFRLLESIDTSETRIKIIDWDDVKIFDSSTDIVNRASEAMILAIETIFPYVNVRGVDFSKRFFAELVAGTTAVEVAATGGAGTA